jgi:hypothetical protein
MGRFALTTDPSISGSRLSWGATLDPGTFEQASASDTSDSIHAFRMTADDAAGTSTHSEVLLEVYLGLPHDVMPGDSYENSVDLSDLRDGYYHILLTPADDGMSDTYELHVRAEGGAFELKWWGRQS